MKDMPATTLNIYPEDCKIYVTLVLIGRTLLRLRLINWFNIKRNFSFKELFRQVYAQYILACLDQIKAKVVLTRIDNSNFFHYLSRIDKGRVYFAIQNGTRTLACVRDSLPLPPHPLATISMTNFFCFGQRDIDLFVRHDHKVDKYFQVGSLVGGFYKSKISVPNVSPQMDICLISQWHEHFFSEIVGDDFSAQVARRTGAGIKALNLFLQRLLKETDLNLIVCPRNDRDQAEISFYKDVFVERVRIAESDRVNFSTYRIAEQSQLVIALNSTTLAEIYSWGHKVLWCNILNDDHYKMAEAGISYFCEDDYIAFKARVLMLLEMTNEEYKILTRDQASYINNYDPVNPPHEIIRSAITNVLSKIN